MSLLRKIDNFLIDQIFQKITNLLSKSSTTSYKLASFFFIGSMVIIFSASILIFPKFLSIIYLWSSYLEYGFYCDTKKFINNPLSQEITPREKNIFQRIIPLFSLVFSLFIFIFVFGIDEDWIFLTLYIFLHWVGINFMACSNFEKIKDVSPPPSNPNPWIMT